ncbi:MAG: hypothetical protein AB8B83_07685 [Bdellovibrionales bacterium]
MRFKFLSGWLAPYFGSRASFESHPNQPSYFFQQEHFDAAQRIIDVRRQSIRKQGRGFEDLQADLQILEREVLGDIEVPANGSLQTSREEALSALKDLSEAEKRVFLGGINNLFNYGRLDEKPAFVKWVTSGNSGFAEFMSTVRADQEALAQHAVGIVGAHTMNSGQSAHSEAIREMTGLIRLCNGFVESTAGARTELNKGFGRIFKITTDAMDVASFSGPEFDKAFEGYIDGNAEEPGLLVRMEKIKGSKASPFDREKWEERLQQAEQCLQTILTRQTQYNASGPGPDPFGAVG